MTTVEEDRVKLSADGVVTLFKIALLSGAGNLFLTGSNDITWQGNDYEGVAIQAQGFQRSSDDELARPRLTIANVAGVFNTYVRTGVLEGAEISVYRVLREHIETDVNNFDLSVWEISRVLSMNNAVLQVELRRPYDSPRSVAPARMFIPPEFPLVRLG